MEPVQAVLAKDGERFLITPKKAGAAWTLYYGAASGSWIKLTSSLTTPLVCSMSSLSPLFKNVGAIPGNTCVSTDAEVFAKPCANDSGACTLSVGTIYYGAYLKVAKKDTDGGLVTCSPQGVGVQDPAPGVVKSCYFVPAVVSPPADATQVATDGQSVLLKASASPWSVYYGADTRWRQIRLSGNYQPLDCGLATFGSDPAPGTPKVCKVTSGVSVAAAAPCASDGGVCRTGAGTAFWGTLGRSTQKTVSSVFECSSGTWGLSGLTDPSPGMTKKCYYVGANASSPTYATAAGVSATESVANKEVSFQIAGLASGPNLANSGYTFTFLGGSTSNGYGTIYGASPNPSQAVTMNPLRFVYSAKNNSTNLGLVAGSGAGVDLNNTQKGIFVLTKDGKSTMIPFDLPTK